MQPLAARLFVETPEPRLIGGRDRRSGRILFPLPAAQDNVEEVLLSPRGRLWSYTVQRFRPKSPPYSGPIAFVPFALGYVELEGEVIVEARLSGVEVEDLKLGMPMRLVLEPFQFADGAWRTSYAFAPDGAAA